MALNSLREALSQAGVRAFRNDTPFKNDADAALAGFRAMRSNLERQVRLGDLTPKSARQHASSAASQLRVDLIKKSEGYSAVPRAYLDRLVEAAEARRKTRESLSVEGLQRETNRLLRQSLVEQQLVNRAFEFEGKTFVRPLAGGPPVPSFDRLLEFHESATVAGDEAAREWARRQLEGLRSQVVDLDSRRRIDLACDRPEQVNPRLIAGYLEALTGREAADLERFVSEALASHDANACAAAFVMARQEPRGANLRWVRNVLNGLGAFPDAALTTLRGWEADARREEADSARAQAEFAAAVAEAEARFPDLEAPSEAELAQHARVQSKPVARPDEPIGLALVRRGLSQEEYQAQLAPSAD